MNFALTFPADRVRHHAAIFATTLLTCAITAGVIVLVLHPQRQGNPIVAAPELALDEQVVELVVPDEHIAAIPLISLEQIEYLQWCLVVAESGVPIDQIDDLVRDDVQFARNHMTYEERLAMYIRLEDLKENQPVFDLDVSSIEGSV